jgi:hypothetical protein
MKYSFTKGLSKVVINGAIFVLPLAIQLLPAEWANITLSGVLYLIYNYLKV